MQKEGFVSLWLGNINSSKELEDLLKISYTEDGDFVPSKFAHSFDIERYDDATREAEFYDDADNTLRGLLEDFSYDDIIIPKFSLVCGENLNSHYNLVILLYNFKYEGVKQKTNVGTSNLEFIGSVEYM
ncbi:immunity 22 family protein [Metabacillus idriensis]|uniref:immunity 22 family protein n=1 Tax=Metabacillus idriensis TaxID=324768 RepID=UPI0028133B99|nr:immunity 22 family protein [Metabacillus idriensis]MDR0139281.1 immunity 22 family protein [Metabacillus idriensis]